MRSGAKRVARIKSGSKERELSTTSLADRASVKKINGGSFFKAVPPKNGIVGGQSGNYTCTARTVAPSRQVRLDFLVFSQAYRPD